MKKEESFITQIRKMSEENEQELSRIEHKLPVLANRRHTRITENAQEPNYFILKVFLCIILFSGFFFMKTEDRVIGAYDSGDITELIQQDVSLELLYEKITSSLVR